MKPINWLALAIGCALLWYHGPDPWVWIPFSLLWIYGYTREVNGKRSI
jgi:hypothetical protein